MFLENFFLFISAFILIVAFRRDSNNFLFTPVKLFVFASFLYLIIPGFYLLNFALEGAFWRLNPRFILHENLGILIFIITFFIIFGSVRKIKLPLFNKDFNSNIISVVIILLVLSLYAKYEIYNAGAFFLEDKYNDAIHNIPRHILFMNNVHLWGFIIWFVYYFKVCHGKIIRNEYFYYKIISLFYFIVTIGIPIIQGRRFGVIFPILMLMGLYAFYNNIKLSKFIKYGIILFSTFLLITILRFSQSILLSNNNSSDFTNVLATIDSSVFTNLFDGIVGRIGNVYIVLNKIIEYKELKGLSPSFNSFSLSFQGLIPSFLWSEKPELSIGNTLGKELGLISWSNELTGINAGWIGEGYYYSNLLGVVYAAILYAATLAFFSKIANVNYDTGKLIFLMSIVFLISGFQMEIAMTFNNFAKGIASQLVLVYIISSIPAFKLRPN